MSLFPCLNRSALYTGLYTGYIQVIYRLYTGYIGFIYRFSKVNSIKKIENKSSNKINNF